MKLFRSISRYFRDAAKSVVRNFSLSLASISCIAITLIVVGLSIVLSFNVEEMTKHISSNMSIVIFLNSDFDKEKDGIKFEKQLRGIDNVNEFIFKSKKEWAEETRADDPSFAIIVDSWTDDNIPLLDSYEITVKEVEKIDETASIVEKMDSVYKINYGKEYIRDTIKMFDVIEKVCIGGVIALILVTAFLISNTIKLAIFSRKTEIEIMRLVGSSNISIKVPFIIEGGFIGFIGSIIPIVLISYGYSYFYKVLDGNILFSSFGKLISPYPFTLCVSLSLLVIGLLVGMFGSYNAVKKYLKI